MQNQRCSAKSDCLAGRGGSNGQRVGLSLGKRKCELNQVSQCGKFHVLAFYLDCFALRFQEPRFILHEFPGRSRL